LTTGEFELAHDLLADVLKIQYSPALLQQTYQNMVGYFLTSPSEISIEYVMQDWQYIHSDSEDSLKSVNNRLPPQLPSGA
jgi:hypothetical protein